MPRHIRSCEKRLRSSANFGFSAEFWSEPNDEPMKPDRVIHASRLCVLQFSVLENLPVRNSAQSSGGRRERHEVTHETRSSDSRLTPLCPPNLCAGKLPCQEFSEEF